MQFGETKEDVGPFLQAIAANPADETARLIFADWLEERGDWRAELVRIDHALANGERSPSLQETWKFIWPKLPRVWQAVLGREPIERCEAAEARLSLNIVQDRTLRFDYQCPLSWDGLKPGEKETVRFCGACKKTVHYCFWIEDAYLEARRGHCVAVNMDVKRSPGDLDERRQVLMGILAPPESR